MKRRNKKKNGVILALIIATIFMAIGYAVYSQELIINATGTINNDFEVKFTDVGAPWMNNLLGPAGASEVDPPVISVDGLTLTLNVELAFPGDEIRYLVTVENFSEMWDALYEGFVTTVDPADDWILWLIEGLTEDVTRIPAGDTIDFSVAAMWNSAKGTTYPTPLPSTESATITLTFAAVEPL